MLKKKSAQFSSFCRGIVFGTVRVRLLFVLRRFRKLGYDCFVVKDVKVMDSEKGAFVSMPSYQTKTGDYSQYAFPITKEFREKLDKSVLSAYQSLGKVEYKGVKYAELGSKDDIAHLAKQNNAFSEKLMSDLDKAGVKYQAKIEDTTTISVNKADKAKLDSIKSELVKNKT